VFQLGDGGMRSDRQMNAKRQYTLTWDSLLYDDWTTLWAYEQGHNGVGPWTMLDPNIVNMLSVNQSGATSQLNDTSGFTVTGTGSTIASSSDVVRRGPRSLKWTFATGTPGTSTLTLDSPSTMWYGTPVHIGDSYAFSVQLRGAGSDPVLDVTPQLAWCTNTGTVISTSSGATVTTGSGAWAQAYVVDIAPATSAFALCKLDVTSATVSGGSILYADEFQLEVGTVPSDWQPGVGVYPVSIVSLQPDQHMYRTGLSRVSQPALILQEVGP
jgi:hypothetical protein